MFVNKLINSGIQSCNWCGDTIIQIRSYHSKVISMGFKNWLSMPQVLVYQSCCKDHEDWHVHWLTAKICWVKKSSINNQHEQNVSLYSEAIYSLQLHKKFATIENLNQHFQVLLWVCNQLLHFSCGFTWCDLQIESFRNITLLPVKCLFLCLDKIILTNFHAPFSQG